MKLKLGYNPETPTPFIIKPGRYNFPRNRVIVTEINDQWQADLVNMSSLARFKNKGYMARVKNKGANFHSSAPMYFRNLLGLYCLKTRRECLWSTVFS